ncbi:hypothetical protein [Pseudomonas sp. 910_21]|uniref:hypothetical protein n=1 Tax=Pseudomonas sp. 910_21 TaxID=2604460 RepID=UPI004064C3FB
MKLFNLCTHVLLSWLAMIAPALALIDIQPQISEVRDTPMTVEITNKGQRPEYVSISLSRLINPGVELADERLEPITQTVRPQLYASPFQLKLAPGQSKTVTLKPLESVEQEQVYRLDIKPVMNLLDPKQTNIAGSVVINLAFSALVRQLPLKETARLEVHCEAEGARFFATGNTRYLVENAIVDGSPNEPFNVYPGVPLLLKGTQIQAPEQPPCSGAGQGGPGASKQHATARLAPGI